MTHRRKEERKDLNETQTLESSTDLVPLGLTSSYFENVSINRILLMLGDIIVKAIDSILHTRAGTGQDRQERGNYNNARWTLCYSNPLFIVYTHWSKTVWAMSISRALLV